MPFSTHRQSIITIIFFILLFSIYYYTSFDKVSFGDCIGYVNIVEKGNFVPDAGSASHFLYTNSLVIFKQLIPVDTIESIRLFGSITAIIAIFFVYKSLFVFFNSQNLSLLGALIFAFSFTFWRMASTIEVCTYNGIFLATFLYYCILFYKKKKSVFLNYAALTLGISFWVHVQNIMIIPAFLFLIFYARKNMKINVSVAIILFLISSISLFIPSIILKQNLLHVYGSSNPYWVKGTFTKSISQYLLDVAKALAYLIYNFWYFIVPALYSIIKRYSKPDYFNLFLALALLIPFAFGTFYNVTDNYVYFVGPYQIFLIYIIDGIILLSKKYKNVIKLSWITTLIIPFLYLGTHQILMKFEKAKIFDKEKSYKGGLSYYIYPWLIDNKGLLELIIDKKESEPIPWMIESGKEYIELRKEKNSLEEIKKM